MSMKVPLKVLVVLASVRPGRRGSAVLAWWRQAVASTVERSPVVLEVADLGEVGLAMDDEPEEPHTGIYRSEATRRWSERVAASAALVVITPEYNHSMPASLKNAFDHLGPEWADLPVAWVGYGNTSGGTRGLLAAKQVAQTLGMRSVGPDVAVRLADLVDEAVPPHPHRDAMARAALVALLQAALRRRPPSATIELAGLSPDLVAAPATPADCAELLVLQKACWVDEAISNSTLTIAALHETLGDVTRAVAERNVVTVRRGDRLVASIQWWQDRTTRHLGRLMVAPDQRGHGIARALLDHAESPERDDADMLELSTGVSSAGNLAHYGSRGYSRIREQDGSVTLQKPVQRRTTEYELSGMGQ